MTLCSLGIVDKLLTEFERRVLTSEKAGKKFMDDFLVKVSGGSVTYIYVHQSVCAIVPIKLNDKVFFHTGQHCQKIIPGRPFTGGKYSIS